MSIVNISEINQLAPMPFSVSRLGMLAFDTEADIGEAIRAIEYDQVLTGEVIRWANSAWSAVQTPITSVRDAVVRFGLETIFKLALGKRVSASMKKPCTGYELGANELWRHGVASALAAECLADLSSQPVPPAAFTGALIHDIGKLLLGKHLSPEKITELRGLMENEHLTYIEAERKLLDTDHARVGGEIARYWRFPEALCRVVEHHHDTNYPQDVLLDSVQIANVIAKLLGIGMGSEQMNIAIDSEIPLRMGLDENKVDALCVAVAEKLVITEANWEI